MHDAHLHIPLLNGTQIVVPNSIQHLTPYVLCEQRSWFEDEFDFIAKVLLPGDHAVDVGASFGTYTLAMAQAVGASGVVWAFEPTPSTADCLAQSLALNQYRHVVLDRRALAADSGRQRFVALDNSELNALASGDESHPTIEVDTLSLDAASTALGMSSVVFMKLDAEGAEQAIVEGGSEFFSKFDPLVQFELRVNDTINVGVIDALTRLGFRLYRLIPALSALAPVGDAQLTDAFQLNLYGARDATSEALRARGLLIDESGLTDVKPAPDAYAWDTGFSSVVYFEQFREGWQDAMSRADTGDVASALAAYWQSRDVQQPVTARYRALSLSFELMSAKMAREPLSYAHAVTFARVATGLGKREAAVSALLRIAQQLERDRTVDLHEPFVPASPRFESLRAGDDRFTWAYVSVLDALERLDAFSSYFNGYESLPRLEHIRACGYADEDIDTRIALIRDRFAI